MPGFKPMDLAGFERDLNLLGDELRRATGPEDIRHLRRLDRAGRLCSLAGFATAWIAPNPVSIALLALGMMARFTVGHQVGHGSYDSIPGVPERYTRKHFARGWRRYVDWLDWWNHEDWLYTHNHLHHPHTQAPLDSDVMDSMFLVRYPKWVRATVLALMMASWKYSYYAPRMRRERALKLQGIPRESRHDMTPADLFNLGDSAVRPLWLRDYGPYVALRFVVPTLLAGLLGWWAALSMIVNLAVAELVHNAHTFLCIRPSHCAPDIPLFAVEFRNRREFYVQSVLGTVNYRAGGDLRGLLHGWQNYQVEHHIWPTATLLRQRMARAGLVDICRRNGVPYREAGVLSRFRLMARLFMGLEHQATIDTAELPGCVPPAQSSPSAAMAARTGGDLRKASSAMAASGAPGRAAAE